MRPSLHCMAVSSADKKICKLQINNHNFMIEETILFINIDEDEHYEAETQWKYSITIRTLSKDTVSLPSCLFKLMKLRLLLHVHVSHLCQIITQDSDALREVNSILDNTYGSAWVNTGISTCMCQNPQYYKQIYECTMYYCIYFIKR